MARGSKPGERRGGRAAGVPNKVGADLREAAQVYTLDALETLASIMRTSESDPARVSAANSLLDRAHGKPSQAVDASVTGDIVVEIIRFADLPTDDEDPTSE